MKTVSKWFFDIEPYKSYRQYFNVYTAIALSQGNGIGTPNTPIATRFGTTYNGTSGLTANTDEIFRYALGAPTVDAGNLCRTLIIVVPNTTEYEGVTQMWSDGSAISFCPRSERSYPYDVRGVIQHEAGGHGFGKLADFKAHDVLNAGSVTRSAGATLTTGTHGLLPVIHRGSPHPGAQRTQPQGTNHQTMKR